MGSKYNKKILLVLRALLFIAGFLIGFIAIWQVFHSNPGLIKGGLQIVFYAVCGLVPGALLFLSAKPVYKLLGSFGVKIISRINGVKGEDAAGVVLCTVIGIIAGFLCDLLLSLVIKVLALRIVIDFFVGLCILYLSAVLFFKLISAEHQPVESEAVFERPKEYRGYFITPSAFACEKLIWLIENWLTGSIYFSNSAFDMCGKEVSDRLQAMIDGGRLSVVIPDEGGLDSAKVISTAASRALKIIVYDETEAEEFSQSNIPVLIATQL